MSIAAAHARRNRPDRIRPDAAGNDNESLFLLHGWIVLAVLRLASCVVRFARVRHCIPRNADLLPVVIQIALSGA